MKDTKLPLTHWFFVIFLFTNSRNGVSAKEIERQLGVSYPTALRMGRKVRELLNEEGEIVLEGTVQMDETLQGGRFPVVVVGGHPKTRSVSSECTSAAMAAE